MCVHLLNFCLVSNCGALCGGAHCCPSPTSYSPNSLICNNAYILTSICLTPLPIPTGLWRKQRGPVDWAFLKPQGWRVMTLYGKHVLPGTVKGSCSELRVIWDVTEFPAWSFLKGELRRPSTWTWKFRKVRGSRKEPAETFFRRETALPPWAVDCHCKPQRSLIGWRLLWYWLWVESSKQRGCLSQLQVH